MTAGERIRDRRVQLGMTLRQVSEQCGVSFVFIHQVERGERRPSPDTSDRIARVLEMSRLGLRTLFCDEATAKTRAHWKVD